jgi:triacylglycerol lipase
MMQSLLRVVSLGVVCAVLALLLPWFITGRAGAWAPLWLALIALHPAALGLQFVLQGWQARHDTAPPATPGQRLRAWAAEWWVSTLVFGFWQAWRVQAQPDHLPPRNPSAPPVRGVVLVHGFSCNRGLWNDWMPALRQLGVPHVAVTLERAFGSIDAYAAVVEGAVARVQAATGCAPVLVGHSMGGLAIRAWLRALPSAAQRCHHVVTLGTPHQGTWLARFAHTLNGRQMRWHSDWLKALAAAEPAGLYRHFTCLYSHCDNIVFPVTNAMLPGANNLHVSGRAHVDLIRDPQALAAVFASLERPGTA